MSGPAQHCETCRLPVNISLRKLRKRQNEWLKGSGRQSNSFNSTPIWGGREELPRPGNWLYLEHPLLLFTGREGVLSRFYVYSIMPGVAPSEPGCDGKLKMRMSDAA